MKTYHESGTYAFTVAAAHAQAGQKVKLGKDQSGWYTII